MATQLENELDYTKHCWCVYEQNSIMNTVHVDDRTTELAIIAGNEMVFWLFESIIVVIVWI